jgi:hypothetical protein
MMLGTRTILAGLITILMIGHAGAESKRQPSHSQQQTPSTQSTQPSAPDQRGTDQTPLSVKIIPGERTKEQAEKEEHERREKDEKAAIDKRLADETQRLADETDNIATYTSRLAVFTLLLFCAALGQIWLFVWQLFLIRESLQDTKATVKVSQETLILTHRPKLRVRNITITQNWATGQRSPLFREGQELIGHFYISNVGGTPAKIVESLCLVHPTKRGLPMNRPYEEMKANNPIAPTTTLQPGEATQAKFGGKLGPEAKDISSFSDNWRLYVMGWVEYTDVSDIKRRTVFCREWRQPRGPDGGINDPRFFPVKGEPDYEHEE